MYLRERVAAQEAELAELRRVAAAAGAAGAGKGAAVDAQQVMRQTRCCKMSYVVFQLYMSLPG